MSQTTTQDKTEAFGDRMTTMLNHAAITLMISIGHQTGLFDAMADLPPATSDEIAANAQLNERYTREWLAVMVTGRIVDYDPLARKYRLPSEHAAWLTTAARSTNRARMCQSIAVLADVEQGIVKAFREGGGLPYSAYGRFRELTAEYNAAIDQGLPLEIISNMAPALVQRLQEGIHVAEIGSDQGNQLFLLAREFPDSQFIGYEISEEAIEIARATSVEKGLTNLCFELQDISALNETDRFDLILAYNVIHDLPKPGEVLAKILQALRSNGVFVMQELAISSNLEENLDYPFAPLFYTSSCMHCVSISMHHDGGEGLGSMWGRPKALRLLEEAGFGEIEVKQLESDGFGDYFFAKPA